MTSRSFSPLLVALVAAVHTAVMLLGPCLHELPGGGHAEGMGGTACARHHGDHAPATHRSADDCQVCQFLAQGQLPIALASESSPQRVVRLGPLLPRPSLPDRCRVRARPRAPPVTGAV